MSIRTEENLVEGVIVRRRPSVDPNETPIAEVKIYEHDDLIEIEVVEVPAENPTVKFAA